MTDAVKSRFWGYVRRKIQDVKPGSSLEKTYRGTFWGFSQYANYPNEHFFTLIDGEITIKVPVLKTNLLSGVQHGEYVEIDTRPATLREEVVLRVRVRAKARTG